MFLGLEAEWRDFCAEFGCVVEYQACADLLEASRFLAAAEFVWIR